MEPGRAVSSLIQWISTHSLNKTASLTFAVFLWTPILIWKKPFSCYFPLFSSYLITNISFCEIEQTPYFVERGRCGKRAQASTPPIDKFWTTNQNKNKTKSKIEIKKKKIFALDFGLFLIENVADRAFKSQRVWRNLLQLVKNEKQENSEKTDRQQDRMPCFARRDFVMPKKIQMSTVQAVVSVESYVRRWQTVFGG